MMSDTNAQLAALQAQLAALQHPAAAPAATPTPAVAGFGGWQQPAPAAPGPAAITGISVPVKIPFDGGNIKVNFHLPPEAASSPQALTAALEALAAAGLPLDVWRAKDSGSGGWGGSSSGGGWNRGGYRR